MATLAEQAGFCITLPLSREVKKNEEMSKRYMKSMVCTCHFFQLLFVAGKKPDIKSKLLLLLLLIHVDQQAHCKK